MTKSQLIDAVTQKVEGLTRKQVETICNIIFEGMTNALVNNEKIELRGFGNFIVKKRKARTARNPKTGEQVQLPPKRVVHFKLGRPMHEALNPKQTA